MPRPPRAATPWDAATRPRRRRTPALPCGTPPSSPARPCPTRRALLPRGTPPPTYVPRGPPWPPRIAPSADVLHGRHRHLHEPGNTDGGNISS